MTAGSPKEQARWAWQWPRQQEELQGLGAAWRKPLVRETVQLRFWLAGARNCVLSAKATRAKMKGVTLLEASKGRSAGVRVSAVVAGRQSEGLAVERGDTIPFGT